MYILSGAIIGGLLGALAGLWFQIGATAGLTIGASLGISLAILVSSLTFANPARKNITSVNYTKPQTTDGAILQLREEHLDITKKTVKRGQVKSHKEVVTEERVLKVPVSREDLVIEKTVFDTESPNQERTQTLRIPISEERIEVIKRPTVLNQVSVHNHQFQENKHIEETVIKEQVKLSTIGRPKVIELKPKQR